MHTTCSHRKAIAGFVSGVILLIMTGCDPLVVEHQPRDTIDDSFLLSIPQGDRLPDELVVRSTDSARLDQPFKQPTPTKTQKPSNEMADAERAVAEAWKKLCDDVEELERSEASIDTLRERIQRFLSLVEHECSLTLPEWWKICLSDDFLWLRPDYEAPETDNEVRWVKQVIDQENTLSCPEGTVIVQKPASSTITVRVGAKKLTVDRSVFDVAPFGSQRYCRVEFGDSRAYVAFFNDVGTPFPLLCIDATSGEVLWQKTVQAFDLNYRIYLGLWWHDVIIRIDGQTVSLFGEGNIHYIERFDAKTGVRQFRFAANM